ncbi:apiosidase-like domain-containing protein [Agilicoccus flavus]|uniref:apiosidase-like domain-containing protein n=1 Tax=Agilicoccus flavus TaxID=2775968 RepID=UPI001CF6379E|nr:DUF4038 domain-containing protein [Agilicoccus flavus]
MACVPAAATQRSRRWWGAAAVAAVALTAPLSAAAVGAPAADPAGLTRVYDPVAGWVGLWRWTGTAWEPAGWERAAAAVSSPASPAAPAAVGAAVRTNGRQLLTAGGVAAPWVADTAWWLAQRLTKEEAREYLDARARQGFTVIQMPAVMGGGNGEMGPVEARDGSSPYRSGFGELEAADGPYWSHVRWLVDEAAARGLTVAVLPAWSRNHAGSTLTAGNGAGYGRFLAQLLTGRQVVWMLGGDDPDGHREIWAEVEKGIREVDPTSLLMYHPGGYRTSLQDYPSSQVATVQTGHCDPTVNGYATLQAQTLAQTDKPVLDLEPLYEEHPICWDAARGYSTTEQVRSHLYWAAIESGAGVTYGHHSVWQFAGAGGAAGTNAPRGTWREALESPVAGQIRHLRAALTARPMLGRVADDQLVTAGQGTGWQRVAAARDPAGGYLMAYLPAGSTISLDGSKLARTGAARLTTGPSARRCSWCRRR